MEQIVNKKYFFKLYFHNHIKYKRFKHYKKKSVRLEVDKTQLSASY